MNSKDPAKILKEEIKQLSDQAMENKTIAQQNAA